MKGRFTGSPSGFVFGPPSDNVLRQTCADDFLNSEAVSERVASGNRSVAQQRTPLDSVRTPR